MITKVLDTKDPKPRTGGVVSQASWRSVVECMVKQDWPHLQANEQIVQVQADEFGIKLYIEPKS